METKTNSPIKAPFQMSFSEWLAAYGERLTEAKERRSEMGKVFQLGENHFRTVIYPEAVHYWDAANKMYRSIDNRLVQLSDGLRNAANGKLQVRLKENLVQLANDRQQEISWQLVQGRKVAPKQNLQQKMESLFGKLLGTEHQLESEAVYEGILPGVDWRCKIQGEQFKDEIVFPALEQVQPVQFRLQANGLTLVQDEAEAMHLADAQGEPAFYLPAPYAISAKEEQEYGPVAVQVAQESEDSWLLTYTISESWLAQAVFPVRLDPAVMTYNARCAIDDAYTCSKQAGTVHKGSSSNILRLTQGSSNWGKCDCYFKFDNKVLPVLSASDYVVRATFQVATAQAGYPTAAFTATAHEVLANWSPATLTYNNSPAYQNESLDYSSFAKNEGEGVLHTFDITNLVRKWYAGTNYGVMLKAESSTYAQLRSSALGQTETHRPLVIIDYISRAGLENYLSYEEHAAGRAGTGYVSLFNGNLIYEHQDTTAAGMLLPTSVSHVYNSCYSKKDAFGIATKWKTNYNQALWRETVSGIQYYVWLDEDGTEVYFAQQNGQWKDVIGRELVLTLGTNAVIEDKQGSRRIFQVPSADFTGDWDQACLMTRMEDACGNVVQIRYAGRSLQSVVDGAERVTSLQWASGAVTAMVPPYAPDKVSFQYADGNLTQITYADGLSSRYTYNAQHLLTDVYQPDGVHVHYDYTAAAPYRVVNVKITSADGKLTSFWHTYEYRDMLTIVTDRTSGKKIRYHFNDVGNLIAMTDELGFGAFAQYQPTVRMNKPDAISKLQYVVRNLFKNPLFVRDGDWQQGMDAGGASSFAYDYDTKKFGNRSQRINRGNDTGPAYIVQYIPVKAGKTYTVSTYARGTGQTKLVIGVSVTNANGEWIWLGS